MKPLNSVVYSFFLGGLLALISQTFLSFWQVALADTPMAFWIGGATLVSMGVLGCIIGGLGIYQYLEKWATFGALLPFSGFAMAVGMIAVRPWTTENLSMRKCVLKCAWFVIKFNLVYAIICIAIGMLVGLTGFQIDLGVEKTTGNILFVLAYIVGGIMSALFQLLYLGLRKVNKKIEPLHVLIIGWMAGAVLAPFGICTALGNFAGQGFSIMIPVGGYNMYNAGFDFVSGHIDVGLLHLGSFFLAVLGLCVTALATYFIYNAKFGRKPLDLVHAEKALDSLEQLGYDVSMVKKREASQIEG